MLAEYVKECKEATQPAPAPQPVAMIVQPDVIPYAGLKVRVSRNVEAIFVEALPPGARVTVLEGPIVEGGETWLRVRTEAGNEGWVRPHGGGKTYLLPA